jgi:hypothetical protein
MKAKWSTAALAVVGGVLISLASCGRDQQLVSIQVQPTTETFGAANIPVAADAGAQVQLRALGTYIHPPVTKDITSQVTWTSNTPTMMTVDSTGLLTVTGEACGGTLISATMTTNTSSGGISSKGALVTGSMTGNVTCFTSSSSGGGGTGSGSSITITFQGTGAGSVTSNPSGLNCASSQTTCSMGFPTGITVTVTATPSPGASFGGWSGCPSANGQACTFTNVTAAEGATVTFN